MVAISWSVVENPSLLLKKKTNHSLLENQKNMKQILQDMGKGTTILEEAPVPGIKSGSLLINTKKSLVSAGTERMLVDFGRSSYIEKAKQQPDKVKMVMDKVRTDGLMTTVVR